jgi:transcriptional regulator with XRE-family HTH domain
MILSPYVTCPDCVTGKCQEGGLRLMSLSEQQALALRFLSKGCTQNEVAQKVGVSRRTILRWLKLSQFQEALGVTSKNRIQKTTEVIKHSESLEIEDLVPKALQKVRDILEDVDARKSDQLRAAELIGRWAGLGQNVVQPETTPAEENLKGYLNYLSSTNHKNGNN